MQFEAFCSDMDFNPRAPYGARPLFLSDFLPIQRISIHAPHTGRDKLLGQIGCVRIYFNPRAPYGARLCYSHYLLRHLDISIHAPHTGRDSIKDRMEAAAKQFQSTRPIRGATQLERGADETMLHFNPRAPYGARRSRITSLFSA